MKIKTYTEDDEFPSNCWFADYQPNEYLADYSIIEGNLLIRRRDQCSTITLIDIPIGGTRGISKKKMNKLAKVIIECLD